MADPKRPSIEILSIFARSNINFDIFKNPWKNCEHAIKKGVFENLLIKIKKEG